MPTGATVAALTTSLPETPGGERNWDYRYTWMRDSTFTLQALHFLNLDWEANEFMQFMGDLDGERRRRAADHVWDRRAPRPDRVASRGSLRLRGREPGQGRKRSLRPTPERGLRRGARFDPAAHPPQPAAARRLWPVVQAQAECATAVWRAGSGDLGGSRRAAALRLLQADVLGRHGPGVATRRDRGRLRPERQVGAIADEIREDILDHGVRDGVLRQHYDTDALDASVLLGALFGFLPGDDEGMRKSVSGDRRRADRGRLRASLRDRRDRRRALG